MDEEIVIYDDIYCAKCEEQLTSQNTKEWQHCIEDYFYCNECWSNPPDIGF